MTETPETDTTDSETTTEPTEAELEAYWEERDKHQPDTMLGILVQLVERGTFTSVGVTLTVGGSLVSGDLVSRRPWLAAQMEVAPGFMADMMRAFAERWEEAAGSIAAEDEDDPLPSYFEHLHLSDARWYLGGGEAVPSDGAHVRVCLANVQAWSFGRFNRSN